MQNMSHRVSKRLKESKSLKQSFHNQTDKNSFGGILRV